MGHDLWKAGLISPYKPIIPEGMLWNLIPYRGHRLIKLVLSFSKGIVIDVLLACVELVFSGSNWSSVLILLRSTSLVCSTFIVPYLRFNDRRNIIHSLEHDLVLNSEHMTIPHFE